MLASNSDTAIQFMSNHVEELYAADLIAFLALPGQTITIQMTDLEFGNTEHELTT